MVELAPLLVDGADPQLHGAGDRLDVVGLGFRDGDDDVGIEERGGKRRPGHGLAEGNLDDAVGDVVAAEVDQLGASRSATAAMPVMRMHSRLENEPPLDSPTWMRPGRFPRQANERADDQRVGGAALLGGIVDGLVGFEQDRLPGLDEGLHAAEMVESLADESLDAVDGAVLLPSVCDGYRCRHIPTNGAIRGPSGAGVCDSAVYFFGRGSACTAPMNARLLKTTTASPLVFASHSP